MSKGAGAMGNIMRQAQMMQQQVAQMQEEMNHKTITASSGGGMVTAEANGANEIVSLKIKAEIVNPEDITMLEDLVVAAINEALQKAQEMVSTEMNKITKGLNIPGLF